MNENLISWLEGLSSSMEVAVRAYCELHGECSSAIYQIVLEQAYLHGCCEIIHEEVIDEILDYYAMKEASDALLAA
jgi:hypothetical protein